MSRRKSQLVPLIFIVYIREACLNVFNSILLLLLTSYQTIKVYIHYLVVFRDIEIRVLMCMCMD